MTIKVIQKVNYFYFFGVLMSHNDDPTYINNPILNIPHQFPVVGIGASAGGLEALEEFFTHIPEKCGIAFVVIQHLSPDFKSFMPELIRRITNMTTHAAEEQMKIEPNNIYILPPKKNLAISNMHIRLQDIKKTNIPNRPIDLFFQSLAHELGPRSGAIVLSGTGSDGSLGIRSIHEQGGITMAQDPKSSKFDGMPRSAIATNMITASGRPRKLAEMLLKLVKNPNALNEEADSVYPGSDLKKLFTIIEEKYDVDFSLYKKPTIHRRLAKRLELNRCSSVNDYIKLIEQNPKEVSTLYYDMLIGVTQFFRDKDAFALLENKIIPRIFKEKRDNAEIRIWIPASASGEEVYSVAILFFEYARINKRKVRLKLFGTDIDDGVLAHATEGFYKKELVETIRKPLVDRYFTKKNDGYLINNEVRKAIVFARHNILKDPPFTKMDLISCRNLLIYFDKEAQHDAQSYLYFALSHEGYLILGPSETLGEFEKGYETIDRKWKMYQKVGERFLPKQLAGTRSGGDVAQSFSPIFRQRTNRPSSTQSMQSVEIRSAFAMLLHEYVPPSLLVRENMELHHVFGEAGKYLENKPGPVETNLRYLLNERLSLTLSVAIQRAKKEKGNVSHLGIYDKKTDSNLNLHVQPVGQFEGYDNSYYLVIFETADNQNQKEKPLLKSNIIENADAFERINLLEGELQNTRENLQATIEELETTNEELQSTNEELLASNEELQSTNEELHSVNEELYTVNTEYQNKIDELTQLTNDEENFLKSTQIGTIFLGNDLRVRKFTPAIANAFNLLPQDIDRPIAHITHNLNIDLTKLIAEVTENNIIKEFEAKSNDGKWFLGKIMPYSTKFGDQDGVVLTFTDSTKVKNMEMDKIHREQLLHSVIEDLSDGWWDWEIKKNHPAYYLSPKFKNILGYEDFELENSIEAWEKLVVPKDFQALEMALKAHKDNKDPFELTIHFKHKNGKTLPLNLRGKIIFKDGKPNRIIGIQQKV